MTSRPVTELDFRQPQFRNAKVEDYEFRADGKIVRKDRWECAIGSIRHLVGVDGREFEIDQVVDAVRKLARQEEDWVPVQADSSDPDDWPSARIQGVLELKLSDGSRLSQVSFEPASKAWSWQGRPVLGDVLAWRERPSED